VKKRTNEIYDEVVENRQACSADRREEMYSDRRSVGENWPLLCRAYNNMAIPGSDQVGPGNVFFYEED